MAAETEVVIGSSAAAAPASPPAAPFARRSWLLLLTGGRYGRHRRPPCWTRQTSTGRCLGWSAYRSFASGDGCTGSNGDSGTGRLLRPRGRHGLEEPNINLVSKERTFRVGLLSKRS